MKSKYFIVAFLFIVVLVVCASFTHITVSDKFCCSSPVVRYKFAIYTGECNDETGCNYQKLKGTGVLEYFGLKKIKCPCADFNKETNVAAFTTDTLVAYSDFKAAVKRERSKLKNQSLANTSHFLYNSLSHDIFSYWDKTPWEFYGVTQKPKQGTIACGYFVTNTLSDLGFKIERVKLAQSASSVMINKLCVNVKRFADFEKLKHYLAAQPNQSAFIIGLDFHTGYVLKDNTGIYFMHANYINKEGVIKEKIQTSKALQQSKTYMIGSLTANKKLMEEWVK